MRFINFNKHMQNICKQFLSWFCPSTFQQPFYEQNISLLRLQLFVALQHFKSTSSVAN